MVYSRVVVIFVASVIVQGKAEEVLYRGTADDGTYSEVRQSQAAIPGGASKSVSTFSTRVLGGGGPVLGSSLKSGFSTESRFGSDNLGLLPPSLPSPLSPHKLLSSIGGQARGGLFNSFPLSPLNLPSIQLPQLRQPRLDPYAYLPYASDYLGGDNMQYRSQGQNLADNNQVQNLNGLF